MADFKKIDLDTWPRASHWDYYRNVLKAGISLTKKIDVTATLDYCHKEGRAFTPVFLHTVCRTVNSLDFMKIFADEEGKPCIWDVVNPNFTVFHADDETFSDIWLEYSESREEFAANYERVMAEFGSNKGIKARPGQPANFFCISCVPWLSYDSVATSCAGDRAPALFPVLNYGKYEKTGDRYIMPFTINASHAAMDGYHVCKFLEILQQNLSDVFFLYNIPKF